MDLQVVGCGYKDWIRLAQDRDRWRTLVSAVMNLPVPLNAGNFLTSCKPVSFSRRTLHHGVSKCFKCSVSASKTLVVASKENGMGLNADKTKYMVMSGDQNARKSNGMRTDNCSFERVEQFIYLGQHYRIKLVFEKKL